MGPPSWRRRRRRGGGGGGGGPPGLRRHRSLQGPRPSIGGPSPRRPARRGGSCGTGDNAAAVPRSPVRGALGSTGFGEIHTRSLLSLALSLSHTHKRAHAHVGARSSAEDADRPTPSRTPSFSKDAPRNRLFPAEQSPAVPVLRKLGKNDPLRIYQVFHALALFKLLILN